jgi:hypothetical protein
MAGAPFIWGMSLETYPAAGIMKPPSPSGSAPATAIGDWLQKRPTPIYWLMGPAGSGKSELVRTALANVGASVLLPLSAASPDRCFQQFLGVRTTRELFDRLDGERDKLLILDALETVQDPDKERAGLISDLRLRHLLAFVGHAAGPDVRIVVTSRLAPPRDLDAGAITLIELDEREQTVALQAAPASHPSNPSLLAFRDEASTSSTLGGPLCLGH